MKNGLIKVFGVTTALAMVVAFGTPQVGKRKGEPSTTGGSGSTGSGSSGGGGGHRTDPPPVRTNGGGGGTTGGGNGTSGGGGGRRNDPPPVRTTGGGGGTTGDGGGGRRNDPPPVRTTGGGGGQTGGGPVGGGRGDNRGGGGGTTGGDGGGRSDDRGGGTYGGGWPNGQGNGGSTGSGNPLGSRGHVSSGTGYNYGTSNNVVQVPSIRITKPPQINPGMQRRVFDQEHVGLVVNGWRVGYHHYDPRWCDDYFNYGFYVFNPWSSNRFVCSPWYYYASCPPYLSSTRIIVITSGWPDYGWSGDPYRYDRPDQYNRYNSRNDLDYAIRDLQDAFEQRDDRVLNRLVPRDGNVHLYFDGRYGYSVAANDFYDLMDDGIMNVRTQRYEITDVQYSGRGARVYARQDYVDSWGQKATAYHQFFLVQEGRDWVIREFGTGTYRPY